MTTEELGHGEWFNKLFGGNARRRFDYILLHGTNRSPNYNVCGGDAWVDTGLLKSPCWHHTRVNNERQRK